MPQIVYRAPYTPGTMAPITTASSASSAMGVQNAAANGRLRVVSALTCLDAGDAEFATLSHAAGCHVTLPAAITRLQQVTVSCRPASITYQGIITDELGSSSVSLQWKVYPQAWIIAGGSQTLLTPVAPAMWRSHLDTNSDDHSWGPLTYRFRPGAVAQWTPNLAVPPNACPALAVDLAAQHWFSANDVSLVSGLDVDFTVAFIIVKYV